MDGVAKRWEQPIGDDDFVQPRALFRMFDDGQKQRLFGNLARAMHGVPAFIIDRQLAHFDRVDPAYGAGVRDALAHLSKDQEDREIHKDVDRMVEEDPDRNSEEFEPKFYHEAAAAK